ncbi:hypothetical protein [Mycoplasma hafezii]
MSWLDKLRFCKRKKQNQNKIQTKENQEEAKKRAEIARKLFENSEEREIE